MPKEGLLDLFYSTCQGYFLVCFICGYCLILVNTSTYQCKAAMVVMEGESNQPITDVFRLGGKWRPEKPQIEKPVQESKCQTLERVRIHSERQNGVRVVPPEQFSKMVEKCIFENKQGLDINTGIHICSSTRWAGLQPS